MNKYSTFTVDSFSKRLRLFREERHMSQGDLARLTGFTTGTISGYENGLRDPKCEVYCALADALRVDPVEFFLNDEAAAVLHANDNVLMFAARDNSRRMTAREHAIAKISRSLLNLHDEEFKAIEVVINSMVKAAEFDRDYKRGSHHGKKTI